MTDHQIPGSLTGRLRPRALGTMIMASLGLHLLLPHRGPRISVSQPGPSRFKEIGLLSPDRLLIELLSPGSLSDRHLAVRVLDAILVSFSTRITGGLPPVGLSPRICITILPLNLTRDRAARQPGYVRRWWKGSQVIRTRWVSRFNR